MVVPLKVENLLLVWHFMTPDSIFSSHGLMPVKSKFPECKINNGSKMINPNYEYLRDVA